MKRDRPECSGPPPRILRALARGLSKKCPRCGIEPIFERFFHPRSACPTCRLPFEQAIEEHFAIIYFSTAIQTAMFAAFVLMFKPDHPWTARAILAVVALSVMLLNLPNRKGLAIALDYLTGRAAS